MKESNGFVQESMATVEPEPDNEATTDHQANNIAAVSPPEPHEFSLAMKPKGTPLFKVSALYKGRLKFCIYLHFLLFLAMFCKLLDPILDSLDIFILELAELRVPAPLRWEWIYLSSFIFGLVGLNAVSRNSLKGLHSFAAATLLFAICPLLGAAVYYFSDVYEYAEKKNEANVEVWRGLPVAVWWYGYIMVAFQVHVFSIYFAAKLIKIWRFKMKRY